MLCNVWVVTYFGRSQRKSLLAWGISIEKARKVVDEAVNNRVYIIEII